MKTNTLLIQVDQMHAAALSCLGSPNVKTPNLDRLASEGTLFRHGVTNNPICLPSRISMLSGQYPTTTKQFGFSGLCDARMPWLPRIFHDAGFRTGAFGKFHVISIGQEQWGVDVACPTMSEDDDLARPLGNHYRNYCITHGLTWPHDQMHGHNPYGPHQDPPAAATPDMHWCRQRSCRSDIPLEHSLEAYTTNRCIEFIDGAAREGKPFFAWLTYDRPHSPTTLPEPWFSRIRPDKVVLPPVPPLEAMLKLPPSYFKTFGDYAGIGAMGEEQFRFVLATYFVCIEFIDAEIGRVMDRLRQLGQDSNTTVVFTADHGDEAGTLGLYDKLRAVDSDALTRVPYIIRPASVLSPTAVGRRVEEPVELVDLAPTLAALAGLPRHEEFEGVDLSGCLLQAAALDADRAVVCEDVWTRMIEHEGWRLVFDVVHDAEMQLYHVGKDPDGVWNLYTDPEHRDRRIDLKRRLVAFLMARFHGNYTAADVDRIERGFNPDDPMLPPLHTGGPDNYQFYRAGAYLRDAKHTLWVRFDKPEMWLLNADMGLYPRRSDALPFDPVLAESLLDHSLRILFARTQSVSLLLHRKVYDWQHPVERPSIEEIEVLRRKAGAMV
jgi:arylsulfatase